MCGSSLYIDDDDEIQIDMCVTFIDQKKNRVKHEQI